MYSKLSPVVNLMSILRTLQLREWESHGLPVPVAGQIRELNGGSDIFYRLWDVVSMFKYGNQTFSNDSLFRYVFPLERPMTPDELTLWEELSTTLWVELGEVIVGNEVIFDVSW